MGKEQGVTATKSATPRLLSKVATGIQGFDEISRGGLPRNRTSLVMGGPDTGKTVFALQALVNAAQNRKQPGIFVAFEEGAGEIFANAATFGWALPAMVDCVVRFDRRRTWSVAVNAIERSPSSSRAARDTRTKCASSC
jgi:KaiC/GvpD/RAD55 family RecA-like ATPase